MSDGRTNRDDRRGREIRLPEARVHWNGISLRPESVTSLRDLREPSDERRR